RPSLVAIVGGHTVANNAHRLLGLIFVFAAMLAALINLKRGWALICELVRFRARERSWPGAFIRHALAPGRYPRAFHTGSLDPAERLVLGVLLLSTAIAGASGIYLYF